MLRRLRDCNHLGMSGRVLQRLPQIVGFSDDEVLVRNHAADGDFTLRQRRFRLAQRVLHESRVTIEHTAPPFSNEPRILWVWRSNVNTAQKGLARYGQILAARRAYLVKFERVLDTL